MKSKKGQGLSMETIVILIIILVVLVIAVLYFSGAGKSLLDVLSSQANNTATNMDFKLPN